MTDLQFHLIVKNNDKDTEEGFFFKALPFQIIVGNTTYDIIFEKADDGHVRHRLFQNNTLLADLVHPDYIPNCTVDQLKNTLGTTDAEAIFSALFMLDVSQDNDYKTYFDSQSYSFEVKQRSGM